MSFQGVHDLSNNKISAQRVKSKTLAAEFIQASSNIKMEHEQGTIQPASCLNPALMIPPQASTANLNFITSTEMY